MSSLLESLLAGSSSEIKFSNLIFNCSLLQAEEGKGLLVSLDPGRAGRAGSKEAVAAQWFSQDLFQDEDLADADEPALPANKRAKVSLPKAAGTHYALPVILTIHQQAKSIQSDLASF